MSETTAVTSVKRSGRCPCGMKENEEEPTMIEVPIWQKANLTVEEAAAYSGVGKGKLRAISDDESCDFVLWIGTKRLIKRKKLDEYLEKAFSI